MALGSILLCCSLLISVLMQPSAAIDDFLAPLLTPILDGVCNAVECGKGNCTASWNHTFAFVCECDPGWKKIHVDDNFGFLPCVIPNCTLNISSADAMAPPPAISEKLTNLSFLDPCLWSFCGEGTCVRTSAFGHRCDCNKGYINLLNVTSLPCFTQCVLGADCTNQGLGLTNISSTSSPPVTFSGSTENNHACFGLSRNLLWLTTLMTPLAIVLWM